MWGTLSLDFLTLFTARWEKCVAKDDVAHAGGVRVRHKVWIDVEENRHVHLLAGLETLLFEAKTLYFIEVNAGALWRDIVGGHACTNHRRKRKEKHIRRDGEEARIGDRVTHTHTEKEMSVCRSDMCCNV